MYHTKSSIAKVLVVLVVMCGCFFAGVLLGNYMMLQTFRTVGVEQLNERLRTAVYGGLNDLSATLEDYCADPSAQGIEAAVRDLDELGAVFDFCEDYTGFKPAFDTSDAVIQATSIRFLETAKEYLSAVLAEGLAQDAAVVEKVRYISQAVQPVDGEEQVTFMSVFWNTLNKTPFTMEVVPPGEDYTGLAEPFKSYVEELESETRPYSEG